MKDLSFYEQIGIVVPGSVLVFGLLFLFPDLRNVLAEGGIGIGSFGIFVLIAYAAGHLAAALGNLIEKVWWIPFGGMPSDWVLRDNSTILANQQIERLKELVQKRLGFNISQIKGIDRREWGHCFQQLYRDVLAHNPGRIETFNGNYGLNRGLSSAFLVLAVVSLTNSLNHWDLALGLAVLSGVHLYRMYRFGIHFSREVYCHFLLLSSQQPSTSAQEEQPSRELRLMSSSNNSTRLPRRRRTLKESLENVDQA